MPRSVVIYTSPEALASLREKAGQKFASLAPKPYTFSFGQRSEAGLLRARITEVADGALVREWTELVERGEASIASSADRDVRNLTFEELLEDADRSRREATVQLVSPVICGLSGQPVPFPVLSAVFDQYITTWNAFSPFKIDEGKDGLQHVHIVDFRLSCVATPFGPGSQGWIKLEMEKGRTESEIGLFNALIDFAFFCGSGLHVQEGLGQTRRMEKQETRTRPQAAYEALQA